MPASGRVLLDTNIVIALFREEEAIAQHLAECDEVFVPSIVIGELYFGAARSSRETFNRQRVALFAAGSLVLPCDSETAQRYGELKNILRAAGRPIPDNDIWIAAVAIQYGLTLVTRDEHFAEVRDVLLERW